MKHLFAFAGLLALISTAHATSTINATNNSAYGANIGWTNWLPSAADGVVIGEYICSGYIYGANVGWINVGSGSPVNGIQYQNNAANDFGVNYGIDPSQPNFAILRGFAYGANIGWINFEALGNPRVRFSDGALTGYVYSANCGWINLNDASGFVKTDHVAMGADTDGDGIADAFERQYFGNLTSATGTTDADGDGIKDKDEYLDGTSPILSTDRLRITAFTTSANSTNATVTWTSTAARLYYIETSPDLVSGFVTDTTFSSPFAPDASPGTLTTRIPTRVGSDTKRFYRIRAYRPLP
ncbi:MAG: hypothetical protein QOG48_1992 [Verrucomicrobiota bacterium]|jgi:hypothetical protein